MWRRKGFGFRSALTKSGKKEMRFATEIRRSSAQRNKVIEIIKTSWIKACLSELDNSKS